MIKFEEGAYWAPKNRQQRMRRALKIRRATEAIERGLQKAKASGYTKPHDFALAILVSLEEVMELRNKTTLSSAGIKLKQPKIGAGENSPIAEKKFTDG